ncbi:CCAAT/enhancer-binding protein zeta [Dorcoceras hygrometricum]|uniref:CCAAT/enhancer-binding protein zeta n=1 Tax=Dorcoceras hygrometricum TaxID=472368 RepID=A0A2Z7D1M5_9LAMI|nr:CCAAT/enhancer-binding protein zeta [Dorcoceras hygrometricum]
MMTKAKMMKSLKERRSHPEGTSISHHSSKGKRKASSEGGEKRKKRHNEEKATEPAWETALQDPISEPVGTAENIPEQQSIEVPYVLLDTSAISFVAKPSGSVSLDFIRRLVLDQDFDLVKRTPDLRFLETASLHFMQTGETANRLSQARDEVVMTRRSMDGVLGLHNDLLKQLEEMRAQEDREKESLRLKLEAARADVKSSKALVSSWSGLCAQVEEPLDEVPIRIGLGVELIGLVRSSGRAARRGANKNWAYVPNWSGLCAQVKEPLEESDSENHELREKDPSFHKITFTSDSEIGLTNLEKTRKR